MKTILVPLDGSPLAKQVLPSVRMLAPLLGAEARLLPVVSEADRYHLLADFEPDDPFKTAGEKYRSSWDALRQNADSYLAPLAQQLRAAGVEPAYEVRLGAPAEVIVEEAEREHVALIAMATHGYSGIKRWALGSVADKVLHATGKPLLLVRAQPGAA
jgi:nucleotide-binding universal stress UspA family protein